MSISKINNTFKIIRRPDYTKGKHDSSIKVEVSSNSNLNNSLFNDILLKEELKHKKKKLEDQDIVQKEPESSDEEQNNLDINSITSETDFYI